MPIDASIALGVKPPQFENPLNMMSQVLQAQGLQNQNALAQYSLGKAQRGDEDMNALMRHLQNGGNLSTPEGQAAAVKVAPLSAPGVIKSHLDMRETQGKIDAQESARVDARLKQSKEMLDNVTTPEQYLAWHQANHADPVLGPMLAKRGITPEQTLATIQEASQTPDGFKQLLQKSALGLAKFTELNAPKTSVVNAGGTEQMYQTPGLGGAPKLVASVEKTQSPDSVASNETTRRGQNMVDARTREITAATLTKPFEVTGEDGKPVLVQQDKQGNIRPVEGYLPRQGASKPLTDTQAKALQFGSRMQAAEDIFGQLADKGVTTSLPGSRAGWGVGATVNAMQPAERQQLDQAKRDFINAVLRRESGAAISPSEFDSAEKQYFPQPGETDPKTLAQKKANRELATRGILAEVPDSDNRVAKVRGVSAAPVKLTAANADVEFAKLPSGAEFIAPDGSHRRKP